MKYSFSYMRKGLSAFCGLSLLFAGLTPLSAAQDLPAADADDEVLTDFDDYNNPFPDTDLDTLEGQAAAELFRRGVVMGQGDGEFHGDSLVNRAEALKFLLLARYDDLPEGEMDEDEYPDVDPDDWFYPYVATGTDFGIINGYPDGFFRPERSVNTVEFLKMLTLTFNLELGLPYDYIDVDPSQWYARYLGTADKYDLFPERSAFLRPAQSLTRDEVAVAMYQYLKNRDDDDDEPTTGTPLRLAVQVLTNASHSSEDGDVIVWKGTLSGRDAAALDLEIDQLVFENLGTAADDDVLDFTLQIEGENDLDITSGPVQMESDMVTFANLFANEDIAVSSSESVTLTLRAEVAEELSMTNPTLRMELDLDGFEVTDVDGDFLTVTRTTSNSSSLVVTLQEPGEDTGSDDDLIEQYSRTPDSRLLVAGTNENIVGAFQLRSELEDAEIDELTLLIEELDTGAIFGANPSNDSDILDRLCLLYSDGDPVLTDGGQDACVSSFTDNRANFQALDLTAAEDEDLVIFVAADLSEIEDNGVGESGMAFTLNLSTAANDSTIQGGTSGDTLDIDDIGGDDTDNQGNPFYVAANRLTLEEVTTSSTLVSGDQRDLLRFRANSVNASEAFLRQLEVEVNASGGATVENIGLYNGDNELIAFAQEPFSGSGDTYRLIVGIEDEDGDGDDDSGSAAENDLTFDPDDLVTLPSAGSDLYEQVEADEVFTIRGDVSTDGADDQIVTTVAINGSEPATDADDLIWRDSGGDDGESGIDIQWINLDPEDSAISRLEHILEN